MCVCLGFGSYLFFDKKKQVNEKIATKIGYCSYIFFAWSFLLCCKPTQRFFHDGAVATLSANMK